MIHTFLKAKHWQLFLALFAPVFLFVFYSLYDIIILFNNKAVPFDGNLSAFFKIYPVLMIFSVSVFFGWFWSIVIGLQQCIPSDIKMNISRFKLLLGILFVYTIFFIFHSAGILPKFPESFEWINILFVPLHITSMVCTFYSIYFVVKTIKIAEVQKDVKFKEFSEEFFLLWFYIIGIWIIQPKVNRLYKEVNTQ